MRVYERVSAEYVRRGGRAFFGLLGEGNIKLSATLTSRHGLEMRTARHEQGAVAMADGYARVTGGIGLAAVTAGPGLVNAGVSIASAARARSRVLLFAGDSPAVDPGHFQAMSQEKWADGLGVTLVCVEAPEYLEAALDRVFAHLERSEAVILSIPMDVQEMEVPAADPPRRAHDVPVPAPDELIERAADLIAASRRPLLLVGRGGIGASEPLRELARSVGMPIATTLRAIGLFHDEPLALGVCGGFDPGPVAAAMADADLVVAVGTSLSRYTTKHGALLEGSTVVRVDTRPSPRGACDLLLIGDAGPTVSALVRALATRTSPGDDAARERVRTARLATYGYTATSLVNRIDPRAVIDTIERSVPHPRHISLDGGHYTTFAAGLMSWHGPDELLFGLDFGAIGQGMLLAIGAAAAVADTASGAHVVAIIGDGGFMMNVQELETAVRLALPLTVIVLNDHAYGQEVHMLEMYGLDPDLARIRTPDLAAVARAFGAAGIRVQTEDELVEALRLQKSPESAITVMDVQIDGGVRNWRMEQLFRTRADNSEDGSGGKSSAKRT